MATDVDVKDAGTQLPTAHGLYTGHKMARGICVEVKVKGRIGGAGFGVIDRKTQFR